MLSPTTCSRSSSQTFGKYPPSHPPQLCHQLSHQQSPLGWPCHQIQCYCGAWVHGPCSCSGCGNVLVEVLNFHRWFCPPVMFLAAFPLPIVSQLPGSNPHAASPATYPIWKCCGTFASSSPLCSLPKASAMSQLWVALPAQLCPTHIPWDWSLVSARLIPCPLPPSTCLYITLVIPELSHTLTSLHVSVFPLLWLYPAGNLSPCWFTKLHCFTSWVSETLAQRDLGVFGCSPGARWVGGSGDAVEQGC